MSAKNKRKGASFELDVMKWFRSKGVNAERLRLSGQKDEGDLVVIVAGKTFILELKNTKSMDLPQFWREATVEAQNYASARGITPAPYLSSGERLLLKLRTTLVLEVLHQHRCLM